VLVKKNLISCQVGNRGALSLIKCFTALPARRLRLFDAGRKLGFRRGASGISRYNRRGTRERDCTAEERNGEDDALTYHVDGVRADHVLRELDVGSVADHDDAAALAINAERHVRAGDPAAVRRRFRLRGVALEVVPVHCPLDVRGRIRVLGRANDEHLIVSFRLGRSGDGHSGGCNCGFVKACGFVKRSFDQFVAIARNLSLSLSLFLFSCLRCVGEDDRRMDE